ncbi:MAG TPA: formate transporter FocA [Candidatus Hydrogenedentes bacterium]|nr:formate transporter FocA [Candidatus Hydrogenedentota bacterium]
MADIERSDDVSLDGLLPPQIAAKAADVGVTKGNLPVRQKFPLAVLAGAFIGMGAIFYTTVITGNGAGQAIELPFGVMKLIGGLAFCLGLILVIVAGAELFTGNNLMVMAVASRKLPIRKLLRNWVIVYVGNFVGAAATAYAMYLTAQYTFAGGALGIKAMAIADAKCGLAFLPALTRGIFCNVLVCLAVWLCFSCRTTIGKIVAIVFPITAFVAAGFEHCVANMYFVPVGLFIRSDAAFWAANGVDVAQFADLTWGSFLVANLVPVTIGNVIGGTILVGAVYWLIYGYAGRPTAQAVS